MLLAGLSLGVAVTGLRKRRNVHGTPVQAGLHEISAQTVAASLEQEVAGNGCGNWMESAFHMVVKSQLDNFAKEDPINTTLYTSGSDINLVGCTVALPVEANVQVAGFKNVQLKRSDTTCVNRNGVLNFQARVALASVVQVAGAVNAEFQLCGVTMPSTVEMGGESTNPGITFKLDLPVSTPLGNLFVAIAEGLNVDTNLGQLDNFSCGIWESPGFIGSELERWCANIIEWIATGAQEHLKDDIDRIIADYIRDQLPGGQ